MKHGRSLSSSLSSSDSNLSEEEEHNLDGPVGGNNKPTGSDPLQMDLTLAEGRARATLGSGKSEQKVTADGAANDDDDDDEEEEEDFKAPKVCYKCNKKIRMERYFNEDDAAGDDDDEDDDEEEDEEDFVDEEEEQEVSGSNRPLDSSKQHHSNHDGQHQSRQTSLAKSHKSSQPAGKSHHGRRRNAAARRSVSMNSAEPDMASTNANPHHNRRKNKWQIQRNLAPKLKRQRSFSANYAPVSSLSLIVFVTSIYD